MLIVSVDLWGFSKDVFNWIKRRNSKSDVVDMSIVTSFGSGQLHVGKPYIQVRNESTKPILATAIEIKFKRAGNFKRWHEYVLKTKATIPPYSQLDYILQFDEAIEKLKRIYGDTLELEETIPKYAELLYPSPVKFLVKFSFNYDDVKFVRTYTLRPKCMFVENLTKHVGWEFERK